MGTWGGAPPDAGPHRRVRARVRAAGHPAPPRAHAPPPPGPSRRRPRREKLRPWEHWTDASPSSPARAAASAASTPCCSPPRGRRSWSTTSAAPLDGSGDDRSAGPAGGGRDHRRRGRGGGQPRRRDRLGGRQAPGRHGRRDLRGPHVLVNNAGILRDRVLVNMTEAGVGRGHPRPPEGALRPDPPRRRLLARADQGRRGGQGLGDQHLVTSGLLGNPGQTNYGAAKAGIAAFTTIAATELARYGVRVNALGPATPAPG